MRLPEGDAISLDIYIYWLLHNWLLMYTSGLCTANLYWSRNNIVTVLTSIWGYLPVVIANTFGKSPRLFFTTMTLVLPTFCCKRQVKISQISKQGNTDVFCIVFNSSQCVTILVCKKDDVWLVFLTRKVCVKKINNIISYTSSVAWVMSIFLYPRGELDNY